MILFWGAIALFFVCFGFGLLVLPYQRLDAGRFLLFCIGASLTISWQLAALSYWVNPPAWFLQGALLLACNALLWRIRSILLLDRAQLPLFALSISVYFTLLFVLLSQAPIQRVFFADRWTAFFHWSDALASWNNWSIQLATAEFRPFHNFYPTGWPGLWSLIYRIQDDAYFWVFAKITLFVLPVTIAILIALFMRALRPVLALSYGVFAMSFFIFYHSWAATTGYMDVPVTMLGFIGFSLVLLWVHGHRLDHKSQSTGQPSFLLIASLFLSIAAITKQAGLLMLGLFIASLLLFAVHRRLLWRSVGTYVALACLPLASYALLYFTSEVNPHILVADQSGEAPSVLGYVAALKAFAVTGGSELGSVWEALRLVEYGFLPGGIYVLIVLASTNLRAWRLVAGQFGLLLLIFATLGLFIFANCCAYDVRNGLWLYALLSLSALNALMIRWPKKAKSHSAAIATISATPIVVGAAGLVGCISIGILLVAGNQGIDRWAEQQHSKVTSQDFYRLLVDELPPTENRASDELPSWVIVMAQPDMMFSKVTRGHGITCRGKDSACVYRIIGCFARVYLITTPTDGHYNFNDVTGKLPPELLIGAELRRERTPYTPHKYHLWGPIKQVPENASINPDQCKKIAWSGLG